MCAINVVSINAGGYNIKFTNCMVQSLFWGEKVYISTCDSDKNIWEMIDFVKDLTKLRPGKRFTKNDKIKVLKD